MSNSYSYRRVSETFTDSLTHFAEVDALFAGASQPLSESDLAANQELKTRWHTVLTQGNEVADYVKNQHRAQSPQVLAALEEMAKYTDVRRPFRLSVIGQKGVGKSALVNALLGASQVQYTPSEVAGKAVSGTRIRLLAAQPEQEDAPTWLVVFLTPRRLWEIGSYLLTVARLKVPAKPANLNSREAVVNTLNRVLAEAANREASSGNSASSPLVIGSTMQIQAANARDTLVKMLQVYQNSAQSIPADYVLRLDDEDVDGPISPYIRQTPENLYLVVDYVERYIPAEQAGVLAGRRLELEDVLGLDDPRDSFFALEAFKEAFAVVMVFKCDRGLNTESSSLLENLFSRDEEELAKFGSYADLNKAIIVANQFDAVTANISVDSRPTALNGIEDIRRELSRYTRQPVPIYLTSAQMAQNARNVLTDSRAARPSAAYSSYLHSLVNLLQVVTERAGNVIAAPDYLDFVLAKRAEIEAVDTDPNNLDTVQKAQLILEMSGLPRLEAKVQEALEAGSILRGRVANAEYYYSRAVSETALCYARQMQLYKLDLAEFSQPPVSLESRLFSKFQHEMRLKLQELDADFKQEYFAVSQRYIHGPMLPEVEQARQHFLETIEQVMLNNRQLIQMEQHISTGETVTDAWRKVFEDINDWLALEAGRQFRALVGPLLVEVDKLAGGLQQQLTLLAANPLDEAFWANYQKRLARLRVRLQAQAEIMAISYYTDKRHSIYDVPIAEALHVGDAVRRRDVVVRLMQERVQGWFNNMWHLLARVSFTDLSAFVNEVRYYVLGLPADGSLLVGLEADGSSNGRGQLVPEESLTAVLNHRYHTSESYRRQYAMREPTPAERLIAEIRMWLGLLHPPIDGLAELGKAISMVGLVAATEPEDSNEAVSTSNSGENEVDEDEDVAASMQAGSATTNNVASTNPLALRRNRLRVPIETRHPYNPITRQVWEITNPDEQATHTRVHFSRIDLGATNNSDRITLETRGQREQVIITGRHVDFWSTPLTGRTVTIRFTSDNSQPGWGFSLDAVESVSAAEIAASTTTVR